MREEVFLKKPPKRVSCFEDLVCHLHWHQPVGIHQFHKYRELSGCRSDHTGKKKIRKIVRYHHTGFFGQRLQKALAPARGIFQVGVVQDALSFESTLVIRHPLKDEGMKPIAGPGICATKRLQHHKRFLEFPGPLNGPVQAIIPVGTATGDHPVQDKTAPGIDPETVACPDPKLGY